MQRSVGDQIIGGLRLSGTIGLGVVCLAALLDGERRMAESLKEDGVMASTFAAVELFVVAILLWFTAAKWSKWVAAVAFLGALKGAIALVAGTTVSPPFRPISRLIAIETVTCLIVAGLVSMRFAAHRPTQLERIGLVIMVFSLCANMLWESSHITILLGLPALLVARFIPWHRIAKPG